ncbi:MAG TPA: hypothetical protein VNG12_19600, partial [Acidimicrobiales bacterium]|nr:hypothetical protein [Acidimicrobiales bacterium]
MTIIEDADELFLSSAQEALRGTSGDGAMEALGWRDLLESVDEVPDARLGVFAFFQAQGRELGSSSALGELMAHPYVSALGEERALTATVERRSAQRGSRCVVVGEPGGGVLIDRPGHGIALAELDAL